MHLALYCSTATFLLWCRRMCATSVSVLECFLPVKGHGQKRCRADKRNCFAGMHPSLGRAASARGTRVRTTIAQHAAHGSAQSKAIPTRLCRGQQYARQYAAQHNTLEQVQTIRLSLNRFGASQKTYQYAYSMRGGIPATARPGH